MSIPALRQPKLLRNSQEASKKPVLAEPGLQYVILTLRDEKKLVVSSDAYDGILRLENMYKCVFCGVSMELDNVKKEVHKNSEKHRRSRESLPYLDEFGKNLVRRLNRDTNYCTLCNVIVTSPILYRHMATAVHASELEKATARSLNYKPSN